MTSRSCTRTSSSPWRTTCWLVHRQSGFSGACARSERTTDLLRRRLDRCRTRVGLGHVPRDVAGVEDISGVPGRQRPRESRLLRLAASSSRRGCRVRGPARDLHGQRQRRAGLVRRRSLSACREPIVEKGLCRQGCRDHERARARRLQAALDRRAGDAGPAAVDLYGSDGPGLRTASRQAPRGYLLQSWRRPGRTERALRRNLVDTR